MNYRENLVSIRRLPILFLTLVALTLVCSSLIAQQAEETLDNDAIVKMVQARLGTDVIIEQIRNSPVAFTLTTNSLIRLKQQGVPDKVITAMQEKNRAASGTPAAPQRRPQSTQSSDIIPTDRWEVVELKDDMTGEVTRAARRKIHASPSGDFVVGIGCKDDSGLALAVKNLSVTRQLSRSCSQSRLSTDAKLFQGDTIGCSRAETGTNYTYTFMGNLSRAAHIQGEQTTAMIKASAPGGNEAEKAKTDGLAELFGMFVEGLGQGTAQRMPGFMSAMGLPQMSDLVNATTVKIEVPFADGNSSIVTFSPQDPILKAYTNACMPPPPPPPALTSSAARSTPPSAARTLELPHAFDGFVFNGAATRAERTFKGTVDEFAAALPGFLNKTIAANGLPQQSFDSQIATILERVRSCASITPQMATTATRFGMVDVTKIGEPYKYCQSMPSSGWPILPPLRTKSPDIDRGLYMGINPIGTWGNGRGFTVMIAFQALNKNQTGGNVAVYELFDVYGVVRATIPPDQSPAQPAVITQSTRLTPPANSAQQQASPSSTASNSNMPSTDEVWKGFTVVTTKRPIRDPNPQAPTTCTVPANSNVELKAGGPDSAGRVTITTLGMPAQKPPPCSYLFFTTQDNLVN
jgi:hypothetical protein